MKKVFTLTLALMATISLWAEITCKTIDNSSGEVYLVTPANMATYYDSGNGWVTNASGGEISSSSYYSSKSGGNNTNYIDPETETSGTKAQASGITLKTADNRSARFYFTGAVKVSAFIAITGSGRTATITVYKKSNDSEVSHTTGQSYGSSGAYEKLEVSGLSASEEYYAKVTATNDLCLYAVKFFAPEADHTKATVTNITVNGEDLAGFDPETQNYNVELAIGTVDIPTVAATTGDDATVVITQATELPGTASVVCTSYDEQTEITYTLNFTVKTSESSDATLSALSVEGCTLNETFDPDVEDYTITLATCYTAMPVVGDVTATKNDAFAEDPVVTIEGNVITIACEAEDGTPKTYTITVTIPAATELVSISESTTWDWTNAGSATGEQTATTLPTNAEEFNFADVLISPANTFNAAALSGIAQFANRGTYFQGTQIKFNTTKPGKVVVTYSNTGGSRPYRHVEVNGTLSEEGSANQDMKDTEEFAVTAGDVIIKFYIPDATKPQERSGDNVGYAMGRISKIVFTKDPETSLDNTADEVKAVKVLRDGQLFIEKNGHVYNVFGACVK